MPALIDSLIDKQDNVEIVGDLLASILKIEQANQQVLAVAATPPKDPSLWKLRVFRDRTNPWDEWSELDDADVNKAKDATPLVNVGFDSATFDEAKSNPIEQQRCDALFNIDVYGYGVSSGKGSGHTPGDQDASDNLARGVRLVRNILMSAQYAYLGLPRGKDQFVCGRWPQSIEYFQPGIDGLVVPHVLAARLVLKVSFNENAPQWTPQLISIIRATVKRQGTGEIYLVAEYDFPDPP